MPIINPTPRRFCAPAMNVSVKTFSPGRSMIPTSNAAAKNKVVISGNHQSKRDTPKIIYGERRTKPFSVLTRGSELAQDRRLKPLTTRAL
jgi:hypothetical protein